ncbi:twitching motility protein PilT [archaeon]|nr:MAG: twitching motility protein PilT [archaeon]
MKTAYFRFYAELNDLVPFGSRRRTIAYHFYGSPAVKDAIEALGVPHVEVDLLLVNGRSVGFACRLRPCDRVAVYPVFETFDITPLVRLREQPLRHIAFIADDHLGKLTRLLRLLGFDTIELHGSTNKEIVTTAASEKRILLSRHRALLKCKAVTHGYLVRSNDPLEQAREVVRRFDLRAQVLPFKRCMVCNGLVNSVANEVVLTQVPPRVAAWRKEYFTCSDCGKIYWRGTHYPKLQEKIARILGTGAPTS